MTLNESFPLVIQPIESPYAGAPYAVRLGVMLDNDFLPMDHISSDQIFNNTIETFGPPGAKVGRWVSVPRSVFAFASESDLVLFTLKWRGTSASVLWKFG